MSARIVYVAECEEYELIGLGGTFVLTPQDVTSLVATGLEAQVMKFAALVRPVLRRAVEIKEEMELAELRQYWVDLAHDRGRSRYSGDFDEWRELREQEEVGP